MITKNSNSARSHKHIDNDDGIDIRSNNHLAQNKPENEDSPISAAINLGFGDVTKNYVDDPEDKVLRSFSFKELLKQPIEQFGAVVLIKKKLCNCPGAEVGKINIDLSAHEPNCWVRKRLITKRYTIDTSIAPEDFKDGYRLGVAI